MKNFKRKTSDARCKTQNVKGGPWDAGRSFLGLSSYGLLLTSYVLFTTSCHQNIQSSIQKACIRGNCFTVELARTEAELMRGLQNRPALAEDRGMLFIFPDRGQHPFWMKNTLILLDMIWIDDHFKIVYVEEKVPPCLQVSCPVYVTEQASRYVLEINGGQSEKFNFKIGDGVSFEYNK